MATKTNIFGLKSDGTLCEKDVNRFARIATAEQMKLLFKKKQTHVNNKPKILPKKQCEVAVQKIVKNLHLLDEPIMQNRVLKFVIYCKLQNYSYNTTKKYFNQAKQNGLFENTTTKPNYSQFPTNLHTRVVDETKYTKFIAYLHKKISSYIAPILIPFYTGLRTNKILQISGKTLKELKNEEKIVTSVQRKHIPSKRNKNELNYWVPIYNKEFIDFIDKLIEIYFEEYKLYEEKGISAKLFNFSSDTLIRRSAVEYALCNKEKLPHGFGIHGHRTMLASSMATFTNNPNDVQRFLQHKHFSTTQKYIKTQCNLMEKEFNKITKPVFGNLIEELEKKLNESTDLKKLQKEMTKK